MFLNGSLLGFSILVNPVPIPSPVIYDKITVYGGGIIDKVTATNETLTETKIRNMILAMNYPWDASVIMKAEFNNNLSAGNIEGIINPIEKWILQRRRLEDSTFKSLSEFDVAVDNYIDYEIKNNKSYIYRLFAQSSDELSAPLDAEVLVTDFNYWVLIEPISGKAMIFSLDTQSGTLSTSSNLNVYDGSYTEHPITSHSVSKYISGNISVTAGDIDGITGDLIYNQGYLDDMEDFISDSKVKILKDPRGRGWKVKTSSFSSNYNDRSLEQISTVSFSFIEVGNLES